MITGPLKGTFKKRIFNIYNSVYDIQKVFMVNDDCGIVQASCPCTQFC